MGEWLFKEDNYSPEEDKDKFVDKSIFSILKMLSKIKREDTMGKERGIYSLSPVLKLLGTIVIIVFVSMTKSAGYVCAAGIFALVNLLFLRRTDCRRIVSIAIVFSLFTAVMLTPSMVAGNLRNSLLIALKVFITITLANILSHSTSWNDLSKALKLFFIPDMFILILELTLKYIYILGEAAMDMFYALKLRAVGKNNEKYVSLSGIAGSLFLKSKDMGEELYSAMECRGFTGEYSSELKIKFGFIEIVYVICIVILIAAYFII